jgi:hypothetical protein
VAPRKGLTLAAAVLAVAGAIHLGQGGYIYLKAQLAQLLIERAWQRAPGRRGGAQALALGRYLAG